MLIGWLAVLALFPADEPQPPRPTDAQLIAELVSARSGIDVLNYSVQTFADGAGHAVCGTARIDGRIEPFSVSTMWGPSWLREPADPDGHNPVREPDHWIVMTIAPGASPAEGIVATPQGRRQWDALARKQTLSLCPDLKAPQDTLWVTDYR